MPLNPTSQQVNDLVVEGRGGSPERSLASMRTGYELLYSALLPNETTCEVSEIEVAGLPSLLLSPPEHDGGLLVWFFGGGFVLGGPELTLGEMDLLCAQARCRGVSVGYRRCPENPMPGPHLDAIAATAWCVERADALQVDPRKVAVGGDSAGGNLAAVVAQRVSGLAAQVLVYPATDLTNGRLDDYPHPEGYLLDADTMRWFSSQWGDFDRSDPMLSPELAEGDALRAVPPALLVIAEFDPLRDDAKRYATLLRAHGVHVEEAHFEEQMHLFMSMPSVLDDARAAIALASGFLQRCFAAAGGSTDAGRAIPSL